MEEMAIRAARPRRVRLAYAAVVALCAALVVLVHHESAAFAVSPVPVQSSMRAAMSHDVHGSASVVHEGTRAAAPVAHSDGAGACSAMGGQHCSSASLSTVTLAPPSPVPGSRIAALALVAGSAPPARTVGRAPPDLFVLSSLRT